MKNQKNIIDTLVSQEALLESGYIQKYAANFGHDHLVDSELKFWDRYNPTYYILEADPQINYGLDFTIWISYKADGINFFKKMSLKISTISNSGLRRVQFPTKEGKTIVEFGDQYYSKDKSNRKVLRVYSDIGWVFC